MNITHIYQQYQSYLENSLSGCDLVASDPRHCLAHFKQPQLETTLQVNQFDSEILLARNLSRGQGTYHSVTESFSHNFSLFLIMNGRTQITLSNGSELLADPGHVWLVYGDLQNAREIKQPLNGHMASLHLDFSLERLRRWHDEGLLTEKLFAPATSGAAQMRLLATHSTSTMPLARAMLQRPYAVDSLSQLDLESATLDLTAQLLRFVLTDKQSRAQRSQIDEAVDIIRAGFQQDITITSLARRVGLNECYLKRYFKEQTGDTVAGYIRRLRLDCAMDMLAHEGKSVQETMHFVGYRHAGHFNTVFKQRFGCLPSAVRSA
ncbi:helix-turn-helix domain-containing protein [Neisseriaceae bacterium CLB008]|nr:helix-turn-helix transcriptional regulator [Neisseriaceae bacterium]